MSFGRTPQRCMRSPAMMKNGMARSGNESIPPNMSVGSTAIGTVPDRTMKLRPARPRQKAIGTPSVIVSANTTMSSVISTGSQLAARATGIGLVEAEQPGDDHDRHQQRADRQGEVEPEDRHAQRQRVLVALGRKDLEPGYGEHDQEQEREQFGDDPEGPLSARPQPAAGARGDVALGARATRRGPHRLGRRPGGPA